jgi:hypothetical protein
MAVKGGPSTEEEMAERAFKLLLGRYLRLSDPKLGLTITDCWRCPLRTTRRRSDRPERSGCEAAARWLNDPHAKDPPDWCPLREGPVLLRLATEETPDG